MINTLTIQGFRGIANGTLDGLAPLTVLVGPNNSGKSTVLESLLLAEPGADGATLRYLADRRGFVGVQSVRSLAPSGGTEILVQVQGEIPHGLTLTFDAEGRLKGKHLPNGESFSLDVDDNGSGGFDRGGIGKKARILEVDRGNTDPSELERVISWADLASKRAWLIDLLRPLLPGLKDLRILIPGTRATAYVEDDYPRPWPVAMAGDGFKRLLLMAARIASDDSGLSLVEEPETHLHVGAFSQVARLFWEATAKPRQQQIVITTHSLEYLDAQFLNATDEELKRAALFRLSLRRGGLRAVRISGEKVRELRAEIGEDLRR